MADPKEILVVPFYGQGHLFPAMELCNHLSARGFKSTLIIPSKLSSSIPSSLRGHPLIQIVELDEPPQPAAPAPAPAPGPEVNPPFGLHHNQMDVAIESYVKSRTNSPIHPSCAVIDVMMSWSKGIFAKYGIPTVGFSTSGACAAAMEHAAWKARAHEMKPGETKVLPGLPEDMVLSYADIKPPSRRGRHMGPRGPPHTGPGGPEGRDDRSPRPRGGRKFGSGPRMPGDQPRWVSEMEGSIALLINTCNELERPFIDYIASQTGFPVWGVGPLLPEQYWKSAGSVLHDHDIRPERRSNHTEDEVIQWLDLKPRGSVIYISFGSEIRPANEELDQLADALAECESPFIWVIQPGSGRPVPPMALIGGKPGSQDAADEESYYPHGLETKVGDRGLIICGWAPQLMILSHPSTGGFLSHCGWNSTTEAIGRGIPILAWPIRGDQFHNAKLVVFHLKVGYMVSNGDWLETVKKADIVEGIDKLMGDEGVRQRATALARDFESGPLASSETALDAFVDFISSLSE